MDFKTGGLKMDNPKKCKWADFYCEYPDHDCCSADCTAYCKKEQQRKLTS